MIILHEYPLSMVDHVGFRRYSYALQPIFKVVSRNKIKTDIMKIFEYERNKTMKLLDSNASRIALTTDMWTTSNKKKGFMAITSHFIDVSWKLQSRLVRVVFGDQVSHYKSFFSTICDIKLAIGDWLLWDDNLVKTMTTNMKVKFEKYWDVMNCLLAIESILDPRYKMKTVQFYYPLVYGDMSSYEIEKLKKKLCDMVKEYEKKSKQLQKVKNSQSSSLRPPFPKRDSTISNDQKFDNDADIESKMLEAYAPPSTFSFGLLFYLASLSLPLIVYKNSTRGVNYLRSLVETDPKEALTGFAEVVRIEPEKVEW
ncbi:hypothetical protein ZIOFF_031285 [Zingiber officinale]|uniref:hAT-like transposase RNase-H fold domain-containing protein n=1 Tax=Zingiber officinale TaxID=94328 RepID=A0A8J5LAM9_ZINOF|nr:hypothetical protein ZIOFF_031285 [Zingiber officinale]